MKKKYKWWQWILFVLGIFIVFNLIVTILFGNDNKSNNTSNQNQSTETSKEPTSYQLSMVQATSQIAIERNGYKDDTSSSIDDWTINRMSWDNTYRWTVVTKSNTLNRVKLIWEWTGKDKDDLILVYLLIDGNEIVNDLDN